MATRSAAAPLALEPGHRWRVREADNGAEGHLRRPGRGGARAGLQAPDLLPK